MSVPQGWKEAKSQDGRTYYYNTITKETSWSLPKPPSEERHVDVTQSKIDKLIENEINLNRLLEETLTHLRSKGENKFVKKAVKIFKQSDADKSGKLSPEEFVVMMKEIGQDLTIQEATQQIQQFDVNDDGLMDVNEFLAFLGY